MADLSSLRLAVRGVLAVTTIACSPNVLRFNSAASVAELIISPAFVAVAPGDHVAFHATGGTGALHFAFAGGAASSGTDATLDASGAYTAGSIGSITDTIVVSDAANTRATATVNVGAALTIATTTTKVAPHQSLVIAAGGGKPPYQFALASNGSGGTVTTQTGVYTAGLTPSSVDQIKISDSNQRTQSLQLTIGASLTLTLAVSPASPFIANKLTASGGASPYVYGFQAKGNRSAATLDSQTGDYVPGNNPLVTDLVQVQDATGSIATLASPDTLSEQIAPVGRSSGQCARSDFDGDGEPELYLDAAASNLGYIIQFDPVVGPTVRHIAIPWGGAPRHTLIADVNADGRSDLVVGTYDSTSTDGATTIYLGDVSGSLTSSVFFGGDGDMQGLAFDGASLFFSKSACDLGIVSSTLVSNTCFTPPDADDPTLLLGAAVMKAGDQASLIFTSIGTLELARYGGYSANITGLPYLDNPPIILAGMASDLLQFFAFTGVSNPAFQTYTQVQTFACEDDTCTAATLSAPFTPAPTPSGATVFEGMLPLPLKAGHDLALFWSGADPTLTAYDYRASDSSYTPFSAPLPSAEFQIDCVTAFDANGDGIDDLLLSGDSNNQVDLWLGEGDGSFARRPRFSMGFAPLPIDIDADGAIDFIAQTPAGRLASYFSTADHQLALADSVSTAQTIYNQFVGAFGAAGDNAILAQLNNNAVIAIPLGVDGKFGTSFAVSGTLPPLFFPAVNAELGGAAAGPDLLTFDSNAPQGTAAVIRIIRDSPEALHVESLPTLDDVAGNTQAVGAADLDGDGLDDAIFVEPLNLLVSPATVVKVALSTSGAMTWSDRSTAFAVTPTPCLSGNATYSATFVGKTPTGAAFLLDEKCGLTPISSEVLVVGQTGAAEATVLGGAQAYIAARAVLGDLNQDQSPELLFHDAASGAVHMLLGPDWTTELPAVTAPGEVFGTVAQPAGLADIVLFSQGALQAEVLTANGGPTYN